MRALVPIMVAVTALLIGWPSVEEPAASAPTDAPIPIECGGYDAEGRLVSPEAAAIEVVTPGEDGLLRIPDVCGGYAENGTFIGDV